MKFGWLVLTSYIDVSTNSIFFQRLDAPSSFADAGCLSDVEHGFEIELSLNELDEISKFEVGLPLMEGQRILSVRLRKVPESYKKRGTPAGGELFSLLYRNKGLAAFSMRTGDDVGLILDHQAFEKYVDCGTIHERVVDLLIDGSVIRYLLFYTSDQAWRADIYEQLKRHLADASWTEYLERVESIVLGYY